VWHGCPAWRSLFVCWDHICSNPSVLPQGEIKSIFYGGNNVAASSTEQTVSVMARVNIVKLLLVVADRPLQPMYIPYNSGRCGERRTQCVGLGRASAVHGTAHCCRCGKRPPGNAGNSSRNAFHGNICRLIERNEWSHQTLIDRREPPQPRY